MLQAIITMQFDYNTCYVIKSKTMNIVTTEIMHTYGVMQWHNNYMTIM